MIPTDDLFLLGILNSKIAWEYLKNLCSVLGDSEKGGRLELRGTYVQRLPIPHANKFDKNRISKLVQLCLNGISDEYEYELESIVERLYLNTMEAPCL